MRERYHWHTGNRVELLVDGEQFFPVMLQAIRQARDSLLLEFYMVSSGVVASQFISALIEAAGRGVVVRWLVDDFGARRLSASDSHALRSAGVELVRYNPIQIKKLQQNFARDHRKLLVVDQQLAFIGGTGISDEYMPSMTSGAVTTAGWHEIMLQVSGPVVADLVLLFSRVWQRCVADVAVLPALPAALNYTVGGDALAKVSVVQGLSQQDIKLSFIRHMHGAQQRIWLATAYFLPSFAVRHHLRKAARRGVDVRVILAGPCTDHRWIYHASKRYYRRLLKAGVRIYEYQPSFLHAKIGVCDQWVTAGSCNLDHWNLRWNLEANLEVVEPHFNQQVIALLDSDMQRSQEITYAAWQRRPWTQKVKEFVWSVISQVLLKIR